MRTEDQSPQIALLQRADAWPAPPADLPARSDLPSGPHPEAGAVTMIETHASLVFLHGALAAKLKRAVTYDYLDYGTAARRIDACQREVALNRRTAPDMYLGVLPIVPNGQGGLAFGVLDQIPDSAVDAVVLMRCFDQDRLLSRMAAPNRLGREPATVLAEDLAASVARFHGAAEVTPDYGGSPGIGLVLAVDAETLIRRPSVFPPPLVRELVARSLAGLTEVGSALNRRASDGWVRRCHGDLHLGNVFLGEDGRPVLFDAIEFSDDFACIDVLYDLAFLLMDLEFRGLRAAACAALNAWLAHVDGPGALARQIADLKLLPLFLSARATIRANVTAEAAEAAGKDAEDRRAVARDYLDRALAYLREWADPRPQLIAIGGRSGTGKSTLARALAPGIGIAPGAVVLRSDVIRKRLRGVAPSEPLPPEAYSAAASDAVFAAMQDLAEAALDAGRSVICDAVYLDSARGKAIAAVAERRGMPFHGLWLDLPDDKRLLRVERRSSRGDLSGRRDASDAGIEIARAQAEAPDPQLGWSRIDAGPDAAVLAAVARGILAGDRP